MFNPEALCWAEQTPYPATEQELTAEVEAMAWQSSGAKILPTSGSRVTVPPGWAFLPGDESRRWYYLANGVMWPYLEAVMVEPERFDIVIFEFLDLGFVSMDKDDTVDPEFLINSISMNTAIQNLDRQKQGLAPLTVVGWRTSPMLDFQRKLAFWALDAQKEGGEDLIVEHSILKLGRYGTEKISWAGTATTYNQALLFIADLVNRHQFAEGERYADHSPEDKSAGTTITDLVTNMVGAEKLQKISMAAVLAAVLVFAKKSIWAILLGGAFLAFRRRSTASAKVPEPATESDDTPHRENSTDAPSTPTERTDRP